MTKIKNKTKVKKLNSKKKIRCNYNKDHVKTVVEEAISGISVAEVSRKYNVPESTIRDRKNGNTVTNHQGHQLYSVSKRKMNLLHRFFVIVNESSL